MAAQKLWIYALLSLWFGTCLAVATEEFQGVPLPENTSIVLSSVAEGVQIYESKVNADGIYEWVLKAPEAQLKNLSGEILGKHYGGPTWTLNDGSQLIGNLPPLRTVMAPDGRNIPWLLLAAKSQSDAGLLNTIDYVARIATSGGVAPEAPPKGPAETARVGYRAVYLFLRKQSR